MFSVLGNICSNCDSFSCSCMDSELITQSDSFIHDNSSILSNSLCNYVFLSDHKGNDSEDRLLVCDSKYSTTEALSLTSVSINPTMSSAATSLRNTTPLNGDQNTVLSLDLSDKGLNFGHLNIQGICGKNMCKFLELKAMILDSQNSNLHIFGVSETKLKDHKPSSAFHIDGFQTFRKDNISNGGGGLIVYVRNKINAKRRADLEINEISCIWLEIMQEKGKPVLIGNIYRPPDSRVEYDDRLEEFIENVLQEGAVVEWLEQLGYGAESRRIA